MTHLRDGSMVGQWSSDILLVGMINHNHMVDGVLVVKLQLDVSLVELSNGYG